MAIGPRLPPLRPYPPGSGPFDYRISIVYEFAVFAAVVLGVAAIFAVVKWFGG